MKKPLSGRIIGFDKAMTLKDNMQNKLDLDCYNMLYADIQFDYWTAKNQLNEDIKEANMLGFVVRQIGDHNYTIAED